VPTKTPFIIVELPGLGLVLGDFTSHHPEARADCVLESTRRTADATEFTTLAFLQGLPEADFQRLLGEMAKVYGKQPQVIASNAAKRLWLYRYHMRVQDLRSPVLRFMVQFQQDFGIPWFRIQGGHASLAAAARDVTLAVQHAERIEAHLKANRMDGRVTIEKLGPRDIEAWERLQQLVEDLRPQLEAGMGRPTWWKLSHLIENAK